MKINKISNYPNINFKSKVVYEYPAGVFSQEMKDYIDKFEEGQTAYSRFLGEGVTSRAYYCNLFDFVIKENKKNQFIREKSRNEMGSLAHENKMLLLINDDVKTTQRPIGYIETKDGGKYLISKFVKGKPSDIKNNPFQPKHIDRLLRNLNRLDRSNIIHPDLSHPNLLLNENFDVNIIDYQWAEKFDYSKSGENFGLTNSYFPSFEAPNNALMFESAALSGYVRKMKYNEAKEFLKKYFENKAKYTEKKVRHLQKLSMDNSAIIDSKMIDFEKAKLFAYQNVSDDVLNVEALKMNIINLHRRQYSCYDEHKVDPRNVLRAIPLCLKAKDCADKLAKYTPKNDTKNKEYFEFMRQYGVFWQKNIKKWYPSALRWIYRLVSNVEFDHASIYFPSKLDDFKDLEIIDIPFKTLFGHESLKKTSNADLFLRNEFKKAHNKGFDSSIYFQVSKFIDNLFDIEDEV